MQIQMFCSEVKGSEKLKQRSIQLNRGKMLGITGAEKVTVILYQLSVHVIVSLVDT